MENPCKKCSENPWFCCGCPQYTEWTNEQDVKQKIKEVTSSDKFYGIVSPEKLKLKNRDNQIQYLINLIDKELSNSGQLNFNDHVWISIPGEDYSKEIRDFTCELYKQKGWSKVEHQTSSENGERPGLTGFKFYW